MNEFYWNQTETYEALKLYIDMNFEGLKDDIIFIPRKRFQDKPAMIVELKWNKNAESAIEQIKNKKYIEALGEYKGDLLLVGINYDKKSREHQCIIEKQKFQK